MPNSEPKTPPEPKDSSQSSENQMLKAAWRIETIWLYLGTSRELKRELCTGLLAARS